MLLLNESMKIFDHTGLCFHLTFSSRGKNPKHENGKWRFSLNIYIYIYIFMLLMAWRLDYSLCFWFYIGEWFIRRALMLVPTSSKLLSLRLILDSLCVIKFDRWRYANVQYFCPTVMLSCFFLWTYQVN